jgi:hypothetical protein
MKSFLTYLYNTFCVDSYTRQRRWEEEYLAKSIDHVDLERRQRELQRKGYLI